MPSPTSTRAASTGRNWATSHGRAPQDTLAERVSGPPALRPLHADRGRDPGEPTRHPHPSGDCGDAARRPMVRVVIFYARQFRPPVSG
jgi:hypothetical protein